MQSYFEKVYADLLGKVIGVYSGRPIENWEHDVVRERLGLVNYYVHEKLDYPLITTDDDISGTLTFIRTIADNGYTPDITPEMVAETWLNYLVEGRSTICWAGFGNLPACTAYYRMRDGVKPPASGSAALNTKHLSEQDGSQIFVDGWAMVCPGDPARAAEYARIASCVAFDGEAIYGAQCWAAMEAKAFDTADVDVLLDTGLSVIPEDCDIATMIRDLRAFHATHADWLDCFHHLQATYSYDRYPGPCPIVPNHGIMIIGLLYCEGSFQRAMMIENSAGWDTDCNAANLGCLLGIMHGLEGIDAGPDWRTPVADRIYNAVSDGGQAVTDIATEAVKIINYALGMQGKAPFKPKQGMRYHFAFPGSVQGWRVQQGPKLPAALRTENVQGHSRLGERALALHYTKLAPGVPARAFVDTFIPVEDKDWIVQANYPLDCSPSLYRGQTVTAHLSADDTNTRPVALRLYLAQYDDYDNTVIVPGETHILSPGEYASIQWHLSDIPAHPIYNIGIELLEEDYAAANTGTVYLDAVTWSGEPDIVFTRPDFGPKRRGMPYHAGTMWRTSWVDACNVHGHVLAKDPSYALIHNYGTGHLITGANSWRNYRVEADVTLYLARAGGIAARVQGLRRYYALTLHDDGRITLTKHRGGEKELCSAPLAVVYGQTYQLALEVEDNAIRAYLDGELLFDVRDEEPLRLDFGGIALRTMDGKTCMNRVTVRPLQ